MILNPGFSNAQALGTNKVAAMFGTASSAFTLARRIPRPSRLSNIPLALIGSGVGALIASSVDKQIMRPIIIVLLIAVGVFVLLRPSFGQASPAARSAQTASNNAGTTWQRLIGAMALVAGIGVYDGAFGGTGLFLIMGFTTLLNQDFLTSAAWAKSSTSAPTPAR